MYGASAKTTALALLVAVSAAGALADTTESGEDVYKRTCSHCHDSGKMGAPKLNDMSEWADRTNILWSDVHLQHVDDGFLESKEDDSKTGVNDAEMEAATNYMISLVKPK